MDLIAHLPSVFMGIMQCLLIVNWFSKYVTFLPCSTNSTAIDLALLFYDNIICKFNMLVKIVSGQDSRFFVKFLVVSNEIVVMQGGPVFGVPPIDQQLV